MTRAKRPLEAVRRYAYTRQEAAESLGMSLDTFERKVQPHVRVVPCGQLLLVPPDEIERWVKSRARLLSD
jgi:hypothetical protein